MAKDEAQSYANHRRFVPMYHYATAAILVIYLGWAVWRLVRGPFGFEPVMGVLLALALISMFYYLRVFPLTVQDRLIRLEMKLRLHEVLPEDLQGRVGELSRDQFVALRFAGDGELPDLVREVLDQGIGDREEIKKKIKDWKADHFRC